MSAFLVISYNVHDPEGYARYNPGSMGVIVPTLQKHGGEVVVAGHPERSIQGETRDVVVILKFPTAEAAQAWHDDPEYAPAKEIRLAATSNINAYICPGFAPPQS